MNTKAIFYATDSKFCLVLSRQNLFKTSLENNIIFVLSEKFIILAKISRKIFKLDVGSSIFVKLEIQNKNKSKNYLKQL